MLIVVPVTALYAGLYALFLLVLAASVSRQRRSLKVGLGDGGHPALARAIRAHGNSVEWGWPMLLLLLVAELDHANRTFLHVCAILFLFARIIHAIGLSREAGVSQGRLIGSGLSWTVIGVLAVWNIVDFARTVLAWVMTSHP
jgi:uncharacterized protein